MGFRVLKVRVFRVGLGFRVKVLWFTVLGFEFSLFKVYGFGLLGFVPTVFRFWCFKV